MTNISTPIIRIHDQYNISTPIIKRNYVYNKVTREITRPSHSSLRGRKRSTVRNIYGVVSFFAKA